jgi:hypothetical protein
MPGNPMYLHLLELAMTKLESPRNVALLAEATRFTVTSCPWLKGRIIRWSLAGVTVKFDVPNTPWDDDNIPPDKDAPEAGVGNYTGVMCISGNTEVTAQ